MEGAGVQECRIGLFEAPKLYVVALQMEVEQAVSLHLRSRRLGRSQFVAAAVLRAFSRFYARHTNRLNGEEVLSTSSFRGSLHSATRVQQLAQQYGMH